MKFGQLIEYNMRNIFDKKLYTKCGGVTIPRLFSKNVIIFEIDLIFLIKPFFLNDQKVKTKT